MRHRLTSGIAICFALLVPAALVGTAVESSASGVEDGGTKLAPPPSTVTYCATQVVGNCGSCSVACPTGTSAVCVPGVAANPTPEASCVTAPDCACH